MCDEKDCGVFRVYTTSEHTAADYWLQSEGSGTNGTTPPADPTKTRRVSDRFPELSAKFKEGVMNYWDNRPRHIEPECGAGCHCVRTAEKSGEGSLVETRNWRQPATVPVDVAVVVRGTFRITFQDFKAKCDRNDDVGEPISYGEVLIASGEPRQAQRKI